MKFIDRGGANDVLVQALAHADALYNFARSLLRDPGEAEDLVQEAYARAIGAAHQFEPGTNLKAWLFRILRNAYLERRRRSLPWSRELPAENLNEGDAPDEPVADGPEFDQFRVLVAEEVAEAVHALPEAWRMVILLDLEGMTEGEVAGVLGCAEGTVKSRLSRARAALRGLLAAYCPDTAGQKRE